MNLAQTVVVNPEGPSGGCGEPFYPVSPCPPTSTVPPPTDPPGTADTGANITEPVAALGLFLALGFAAIWSARKRKGNA